jgi:hypothetical protein
MFQNRRNLLLITLIGYLCFFLAILPSPGNAALLKSKDTATVSVEDGITRRFIELGMSREEAEQKTAALRKAGITFKKDFIFAGGEPPQDYDPPMNDMGYVLLIFIGIGVGAGIIALMRSNSKSND